MTTRCTESKSEPFFHADPQLAHVLVSSKRPVKAALSAVA